MINSQANALITGRKAERGTSGAFGCPSACVC